MFLAIACDNLTKAKEMTEAQEEEERIQQELKEKCLQNEIKIDGDEPALDAADLEKAPPKKSINFHNFTRRYFSGFNI